MFVGNSRQTRASARVQARLLARGATFVGGGADATGTIAAGGAGVCVWAGAPAENIAAEIARVIAAVGKRFMVLRLLIWNTRATEAMSRPRMREPSVARSRRPCRP